MMIRIPRDIHDDLIAHAREGFPLEICGILGGREGTVVQAFRMTNTDASNEHFMMEPREQFAVARELRASGLEMSAIYHSHPESPARPSEEDIRLALTPGVSHVIISVMDRSQPVLKSFKISEGAVTPEEVEVI
jgi:proteasome lid subunit RPN8/RPN11